MSFMSFVNFSQLNLDFYEFRNYLIYFDWRFFSARYATAESAATLPSPADLIYWYGCTDRVATGKTTCKICAHLTVNRNMIVLYFKSWH